MHEECFMLSPIFGLLKMWVFLEKWKYLSPFALKAGLKDLKGVETTQVRAAVFRKLTIAVKSSLIARPTCSQPYKYSLAHWIFAFNQFFQQPFMPRLLGQTFKVTLPRFMYQQRKYCFDARVTSVWNFLLADNIVANSFAIFERKLRSPRAPLTELSALSTFPSYKQADCWCLFLHLCHWIDNGHFGFV